MIDPTNGIFLIADPFLKDNSFLRSVVLICRHDDDFGTFGFVVNRKLHTTLNDIVNGMDDWKLPVFMGGPVQTDTLHYIHQYPQYFTDAVKIKEGVYWGGDFDLMKKLIKNGTLDTKKVKFFLGYSGWDALQLEEEILEDSWITFDGDTTLLFETKTDDVWKICLTKLGGKYGMMIHYPTDPQLN